MSHTIRRRRVRTGRAWTGRSRPVLAPCSQGRNWLMDQPEHLWSDPARVDIDRQPTGAALHPIIPSDVPFEVPPIWHDGAPDPLAGVVDRKSTRLNSSHTVISYAGFFFKKKK